MYYYIQKTSENMKSEIGSFVEEPKKNLIKRAKLKFYLGKEINFKYKHFTKDSKHVITIESKDSWLVLKPYIYAMSDNAVISFMKGITSEFFVQTDTQNHLPNEGWKLHVTASSLADYFELISILCPELKKLGVTFKVVRPERAVPFLSQERIDNGCLKPNTQAGKLITIYIHKQNILSELSEYAKNMLFLDTGIPVSGELYIGGRVYARYGAFYGKEIFNPSNSTYEKDQRGIAYPSWINPITFDEIF